MVKFLTPITLLSISQISASTPNSDFEWKVWKSSHKLSFPSPTEEARRYSIFNSSREFVKNHNIRASQGLETYTVSLNKFAALTEKEFEQLYLNKKQDDPTLGIVLEYDCEGVKFVDNGTTPPGALSYVDGETQTGDVRVTSVKDQGSCGSCWSFAASAVIEAHVCGDLNQKDCATWSGLAPQQMVDCGSYTPHSSDPNIINLNPYDNHGCGGGWEANALRYVELQGGQMNWDDYPYVSGTTKTEGTCVYDAAKANLDIVSGCGGTTRGDETELVSAIAQLGPMSVGIDAGGRGFSLYSGGVYSTNNCNNEQSNHAVTVVGYGRYLDGQLYWEVKNSWGTGWGMGGYVLMARDYNNMCGIANDAHYVFSN